MDFTFMAAPMAACLIYPLIFTYFGIHVLRREIIFVDLSLAQLAALGTSVGFALNIDEHSLQAEALSFIFILLGAGFFTWSRRLQSRIPQEAVIGIVYVVGSAAAILAVSKHVHGAEHIKSLLNGSILWMSWEGIGKLLVVSILVAGFHWKFRERFQALSKNYRNLDPEDKSMAFWDFAFYFSLGLVIVTSIESAGIYLIFTFLIVPAVCSSLFFETFQRQYVFGAFLGIATSLTGLFVSYFWDLPTGSTQVCAFGFAFLISLGFGKTGGSRV